METKQYTTIDRSKWPSGPWDSEPDKVQWPDAATGLPCLAVRSPRYGHWCGYVGVAPGHPLHGSGYDSSDATSRLQAHGGLTFANSCEPRETEAEGICHVAAPGEPDNVWWFGFDCAHFQDLQPAMQIAVPGFPVYEGSIYRTLDYVRENCASLAQQLHAIADGGTYRFPDIDIDVPY